MIVFSAPPPCAKCGKPITGAWYKDSCSFDIYHLDCYESRESVVFFLEEAAEVTPESWKRLKRRMPADLRKKGLDGSWDVGAPE